MVIMIVLMELMKSIVRAMAININAMEMDVVSITVGDAMVGTIVRIQIHRTNQLSCVLAFLVAHTHSGVIINVALEKMSFAMEKMTVATIPMNLHVNCCENVIRNNLNVNAINFVFQSISGMAIISHAPFSSYQIKTNRLNNFLL